MDPDDYDGGSVFEAAFDAGFWSPEEVDELRDIIKLVELKPTPGDRAMAALILLKKRIDNLPPKEDGMVEDPHVTWARVLLG